MNGSSAPSSIGGPSASEGLSMETEASSSTTTTLATYSGPSPTPEGVHEVILSPEAQSFVKPDYEMGFNLRGTKRSFELTAETEEQPDRWLDYLNGVDIGSIFGNDVYDDDDVVDVTNEQSTVQIEELPDTYGQLLIEDSPAVYTPSEDKWSFVEQYENMLAGILRENYEHHGLIDSERNFVEGLYRNVKYLGKGFETLDEAGNVDVFGKYWRKIPTSVTQDDMYRYFRNIIPDMTEAVKPLLVRAITTGMETGQMKNGWMNMAGTMAQEAYNSWDTDFALPDLDAQEQNRVWDDLFPSEPFDRQKVIEEMDDDVAEPWVLTRETPEEYDLRVDAEVTESNRAGGERQDMFLEDKVHLEVVRNRYELNQAQQEAERKAKARKRQRQQDIRSYGPTKKAQKKTVFDEATSGDVVRKKEWKKLRGNDFTFEDPAESKAFANSMSRFGDREYGPYKISGLLEGEVTHANIAFYESLVKEARTKWEGEQKVERPWKPESDSKEAFASVNWKKLSKWNKQRATHRSKQQK